MLIPEDWFPLLNLKYANCLVKPLRLIKMFKTGIEFSHASYRKMGKPVLKGTGIHQDIEERV